MSGAAKFAAALQERAGPRRRVTIEDIWTLYRAQIRGSTGDTEARAELARLLTSLAEQNLAELPKGRAGWDASVEPPLPAWIALRRPSRASESDAAEPPTDPQAIAWPPELLFAAQPRFRHMLDNLVAVKAFLADGGRTRPEVPLRERSLQIFGDEKRLDGLLKGVAFREGHLTLAMLRCYRVAPPLVFEAVVGAAAPHLLVLENLHTYESFRRWNAKARRYAAIVYGHGSEFRGTVRDLPRVCRQTGASAVEYFGDVDREGLCIPVQAQRALAATGCDLVLRPAAELYALLIAEGQRLACAPRELGDDGRAALAWLGEPMASVVSELLAAGFRLAQEDVGTERLASVGPGLPE